MARLRLFGPVREAAGTGSVEASGATVAAVLNWARAEFGPAFAALLDTSRVWVNGVEAGSGQEVGVDDEVAVLPPVSGG